MSTKRDYVNVSKKRSVYEERPPKEKRRKSAKKGIVNMPKKRCMHKKRNALVRAVTMGWLRLVGLFKL